MGVVLGIRCLAFVREHLQCLDLASIDYLRTDQLSTLLTEIEAVVNTRPIVHVGSDDHLALSPADLLQQHTTLGLPDITVKSDDPDFCTPWYKDQHGKCALGCLEKRTKHCQQLLETLEGRLFNCL